MALRLPFKIQSSFWSRFGKILYSKTADPEVESSVSEDDIPNTTSKPANAKKITGDTYEEELQPSRHPEFYTPNMEPTHYPVDVKNHQYRSLEKSSTHQSIIFPLKKTRLANPFPDPVKTVESETVSDQEKAAQMQASAQIPQEPLRTTTYGQYRYYCTMAVSNPSNDQKCQKLNQTEGISAKQSTHRLRFVL